MSVLRDACQSALQFAKTFNIDLLSVSFQCRTSKDIVKLDYNKEMPSPTYNSAVEPENVHTIYQVLFLLNKFAVSDEFFHELAMLFPSLPRLYTVKLARKRISECTVIKRLPSPYYGAYRPLTECIQEVLLSQVPVYTC